MRSKVLRKGGEIIPREWKQDQWPGCFHLGAFHKDKMVGILTAFPNPFSGMQASFPYQFRGMAVEPNYQKMGVGKALLEGLEDFLSNRNADFLWCNARSKSLDFYLNQGYKKHGLEFIIEGIGPHYKCYKFLNETEDF